MAAYFIDCDGTFFYFGSAIPLPGAYEGVKGLLSEGNQVFFVTARNDEWSQPFRVALKQLFGDDVTFIHNVQNPRVVVNDEGATAINVEKNAPWRTAP